MRAPNFRIDANGSSLARLVRRFGGAKWRLRHYAGIPCVHLSGREDDMLYETALDDCHALADAIEAAGGGRPEVADIKKEFQIRASLMISEAARRVKSPNAKLSHEEGGKEQP